MSDELTVEESGDYASCPYCCQIWPNDMLRDDKRMPVHNFAQFRADCIGSGEFPVAPDVAYLRAWKHSQEQKQPK